MKRMFVEAPLTPGAAVNDAAQFLMAELDKKAAEANRRVVGNVQIFEGASGFGERVLRIESNVA